MSDPADILRTSVPAFVTGVSFPQKKPGGVTRAWLELEDDTDCHPFKIAVPVDFAREIAKRLAENDGEEFTVTITISDE